MRDIQIGQTIPPLDTFNVTRTFVTDAEAIISVDGRDYPMRLQESSAPSPSDTIKYSPNFPDPLKVQLARNSLYEVPGLIAEAGKTYQLRVRWNGLEASAETFTPRSRTLQNVNVQWDSADVEANLYNPDNFSSIRGTVRAPIAILSANTVLMQNESLYEIKAQLVNLQTKDSSVNFYRTVIAEFRRDSAHGMLRLRFGGLTNAMRFINLTSLGR